MYDLNLIVNVKSSRLKSESFGFRESNASP
jgi:hypothetical protein